MTETKTTPNINPAEAEPLPLLEAENLTKSYDDGILALDHLNLAVMPGQIYVMLGANGAGKTTTINLFLNFIEPTSGEARIKGIATHQQPLEAKKYIAYVSENVMLYPNFTAMQNLDYFTRLAGKTGFTKADYAEVLTRVGLEPQSHHKKLRDFSKGMRQKCGIAIAMMKDAPAILLDEPTSGLDPQAGHEFIQLLAEIRKEGKAILMSSHDIFRAREIADAIGILKQGRLILQQSRDEFAHEDLEQLYLKYMSGHLEAA